MSVRIRRAGVREAKAHLGRLLRDAQRGQEWIITARGRPVAKLVPARGKSLALPERIRRLEESGLIEPAKQQTRVSPPMPLPLKEGLAQRWLQEDRGR
jgi:prevent-host-death family protein